MKIEDEEDLQILTNMIDKYSLQSVVSAMATFCSERSVHLATDCQDVASAMGWMSQARQLNNLVGKWANAHFPN